MATQPDELIPTRRSLLKRLKNWEDQASWKDFFDTYWRLIYNVARKAGLPDSEAQDVVQETIFAVAKKIGGFDYDPAVGSFKGWLMRLTHWRLTDHWRKKQYEQAGKRLPREEPLPTSILQKQPAPTDFDLEKAWQDEWEKNILQLALDKVKTRVKPRQYQMFYLHVVRNLDAKKVCRKLGVKLPEIYYAKYKISALVKREVKVLEEQMT
jgi:RNA polymerase sigma factor (sigma-70 family)